MTKKTTLAHQYTDNNKVTLVPGGKEYFDLLLQMIGQAKDTIHFQVYIFDEDETGWLVANALLEAAKRGWLMDMRRKVCRPIL